ncbi:MAG: ribosomal protein S18-alanine N-acetyltransferase [Clostridia bacterium]|nr:ribosomal protein S18-alanine N-acetyltransferase [Clostridia bacterium]
MQIRAWRYRDILKISEMEKECFPQEPWSFHTLVNCFEQDSFSGIVSEEEDGEITGYAGISVAADEADVQNIAVTEAYRKSGVGTALLDALLKIAKEKGVKKAFLEVRVSNSPAMSLYLKAGFKGVYARTRYYTDGEDCLVMAKDI